jgi:methyl-accepting chemotaxis protein
MTIKAKIIILILISLGILGISISSFSIYNIKHTLLEVYFHELTAVRESKSNQLTRFFDQRTSDIEVLSKSENVKNIVDDLIEVHERVGVKANTNYFVKHPFAKEKKEKHEEFFQTYVEEYGYYDVFVICAKHGHVMYTAAKESDYGANLVHGPLKDSSLARLWKKVKDTNTTSYVDMEPYGPSANAPAMFIGTPIEVNGQVKAILAFQISDEAINNVMQFRKGYGKSQEDYLVGTDKLMRSDSYLDPKGHSLKASFANPSKGKVDTYASREALAGKTDTKIVIDYNGNPVLSAYAPIKIGEDIVWAILSEIDEAEVLEKPNSIRNTIIVISIVVFILIFLVAIYVINQSLVKPLALFQNGLLSFFTYLNRESNNVTPIKISNNDEIGSMSVIINQNIQNIKDGIDQDNAVLEDAKNVLSRVKNGWYSQHIETSTKNPSLESLKNDVNEMISATKTNFSTVNKTLQEYASNNYTKELVLSNIEKGGVFEQLINDINTLRVTITNILVTNKKNGLIIDDSSNSLLNNVDTLNKASNEAAASIEETAAALEEITGNVASTTEKIAMMSNLTNTVTKASSEGGSLAQETTDAMDEINNQVTSINEAITVIDQIAFQTNILSLNAAVEAATAGEAGKGFAVVAAEVRNLASRSAEAAKEIKDLVEKANEKANAGKLTADKMINGYGVLSGNIEETIKLIDDVNVSSKEQQKGIVQINDAINSLDQQTQKNAEIASQTKGIAENTSNIAKNIVKTVDEKEFVGKNDTEVL